MPNPKVEPRAVAQEALRQADLMRGMQGTVSFLVQHAIENNLEVTASGAITIPGVYDTAGNVLAVAQIVKPEEKDFFLVV